MSKTESFAAKGNVGKGRGERRVRASYGETHESRHRQARLTPSGTSTGSRRRTFRRSRGEPRRGDEDAYPALEMKAAVLLERLARNHPLPDGNKRAVFGVTVPFCKLSGRRWREPDAEVDAAMVERVAGEVESAELANWIEERTAARSDDLTGGGVPDPTTVPEATQAR